MRERGHVTLTNQSSARCTSRPITAHLALPQVRVVAVRVLAAGPRRALSGLGAEVGVSTVGVPAAPAHLVRGVADGGGVAAVIVTVAAWTQALYIHTIVSSPRLLLMVSQ